MAYPKIVYDPGTGDVTLAFTYPDVQKPFADPLEAVRHDSITSSGLRQTMLERVDIIKNVQVDSIPWADLPNWQAFFTYAVRGGSFSYYPDSDSPDFQTWELTDDKFDPKFNLRGLSKLSFKLRLVPGGDAFP